MRHMETEAIPVVGEERVVLLDELGTPIGSESKAAVHTDRTPLHLAFSCYVFDRSGRTLLTRRSVKKKVFPGVWTNTCCGHPAPGELIETAIRRRMRSELDLEVGSLTCALPTFRYTAEMNGIVENEMCPVFLGFHEDGPGPGLNPDEVGEHAWVPWGDYLTTALRADSVMSPWSRMQVDQLHRSGLVETFLSHTASKDPIS